MKMKKKALAFAILSALAVGAAAPAYAMPQGGEVVNGTVSVIPGLADGGIDSQDWGNGKWGISGADAAAALSSLTSGTELRSNSSDDNGSAVIIRWKSFDMANGENLTLNTADSKIPLVNLVSSGTATTLAGQIRQKGTAGTYIVNPSGINVSGTLDAVNLTLSTAEASDEDWKTPAAVTYDKAKGGIAFDAGAAVTAYNHFATQSTTLSVAEGVTITLNPDGNNNYVDDGTGNYVPEAPTWDHSSIDMQASDAVTVDGTVTVADGAKIPASGSLVYNTLKGSGTIASAIVQKQAGETPEEKAERERKEAEARQKAEELANAKQEQLKTYADTGLEKVAADKVQDKQSVDEVKAAAESLKTLHAITETREPAVVSQVSLKDAKALADVPTEAAAVSATPADTVHPEAAEGVSFSK